MTRTLWLLVGFLAPVGVGAAEWVDLFDGQSTKGWTPRTEVERFEAVDGELHLHSKKNTWVTTDLTMRDFEVEMEVMLPEDAAEVGFNSGLGFRMTGEEGKPQGYQSEIDLKIPGGVFGIGLGGWLSKPEDSMSHFKKGDWNHFRVVAQGSEITAFLNGELISSVHHTESLGGFFGVQHHGKGGTVKFRNIRARKLYPNILWLTTEDMSPTLGCYGDAYAVTPYLDAFAQESVLYENAFAVSPVCSPSRSTLITGMYNVSQGTHQMRSAFPLPTGVVGFPSYLREAGYYTTNNVKTDYNTGDIDRVIQESWDESSDTAHWRNADRNADQPFFSVFNEMVSHQSRTMVWPYEAFQQHVQSQLDPGQIHDPETVPVPPYYPNTPVMRRGMARYYDCLTVMDMKMGGLLEQLKEDGLEDDTIVFFYSDHGSGMPRHKRLLHDSGMQVALIIRFPEKYQHLAPSEPGSRTDRLVSFVDFPPTVLSLLGMEIPDYMQGSVFLGSEMAEEREYVYGSRDRVDEVFELARSLRSKEYLYLRNYHPHLSHNQPSVFSDLGDIRDEIYALSRPEKLEKLTKEQRDYAGPTKPAEALYDVLADPEQLTNLLEGEVTNAHQAALDQMRAEYVAYRKEIQDLGAVPEEAMWGWIRREGAPMRDIVLGETEHQPDLATHWSWADRIGMASEEELLALLTHEDSAARLWAMVGLRSAGSDRSKVVDHLGDVSPAVRIETASWLAEEESYREVALDLLQKELTHEDWWSALQACRAIELMGEEARSALPAMRVLYDEHRTKKGDDSLYLAFSAGAYLDMLGEPTLPWDFTPGAGSFSADPPPKKE